MLAQRARFSMLLARTQPCPCHHMRAASKNTKTSRWVSVKSATSNTQPVAIGATVVTDNAVPEGHQSLHKALYGDGGAEQHDVNKSAYNFRQGEDDGGTILKVEDYLEDRDGEKPLGIYALYDNHKNIQYIGYSRNIVLTIKAHLKRVGPEACAYIRPMVFANRAMATRQNLEDQVQNWIDECGTIPPGNGAERSLWEGQPAVPTHMSEAERAEYEDKKLKMQKAMGENLHEVQGDETTKERRDNLIKALGNDDWSEVIDRQTKDTISPPAGSSQQQQQQQQPETPIVSPFTQATVHRSIGKEAGPVHKEMSVENVNQVLDEVRPYLMADGGDVYVVNVENGYIYLRLEGACSTCASSSATMKMGIERALQAAFGDDLKEVVQVDKIDVVRASVENVDLHLDMLRGAIHNFGGKVEVVSLEKGKCVVKYKGPAPIGKGVSAAIKDRFPEIRQVVLMDF